MIKITIEGEFESLEELKNNLFPIGVLPPGADPVSFGPAPKEPKERIKIQDTLFSSSGSPATEAVTPKDPEIDEEMEFIAWAESLSGDRAGYKRRGDMIKNLITYWRQGIPFSLKKALMYSGYKYSGAGVCYSKWLKRMQSGVDRGFFEVHTQGDKKTYLPAKTINGTKTVATISLHTDYWKPKGVAPKPIARQYVDPLEKEEEQEEKIVEVKPAWCR